MKPTLATLLLCLIPLLARADNPATADAVSPAAAPAASAAAGQPPGAALAPATTPGLVLAMDRPLPGATDGKIRPLLKDEARAILSLYLAGTIREWYFRQDRPGAVFILDTNVDTARKLLGELPLAKAGLVAFDVVPLGPYIPLSTLLQDDGGGRKHKHR